MLSNIMRKPTALINMRNVGTQESAIEVVPIWKVAP